MLSKNTVWRLGLGQAYTTYTGRVRLTRALRNCRKCGKIPTSDNLIVIPEFLLNLNKIRILCYHIEYRQISKFCGYFTRQNTSCILNASSRIHSEHEIFVCVCVHEIFVCVCVHEIFVCVCVQVFLEWTGGVLRGCDFVLLARKLFSYNGPLSCCSSEV